MLKGIRVISRNSKNIYILHIQHICINKKRWPRKITNNTHVSNENTKEKGNKQPQETILTANKSVL